MSNDNIPGGDFPEMLSERELQAWFMVHKRGYTLNGAANRMGVDVSTVGTYLQRAREKRDKAQALVEWMEHEN